MNRTLIKLLSAALFFVGCQGIGTSEVSQSSNNRVVPVQTTAKSELERGKKKTISGDYFTLSVPTSLHEHPRSGLDSSVRALSDENFHVMIEWGAFATRPDGLSDFPEYTERWVEVDGERARLVSFNYGDRTNLLNDPEKSNVLAAYFAESPRVRTNLVIWINFANADDHQRALEIVDSLTFK